MSLRDALLKAGAVNQKQVRKANRDLKQRRKQKQSRRDKKQVVEARQEETQKSQREERQQERLKARRESQVETEARARALRTRHLIEAHTVGFRDGPVRFHHLDRERRVALRMRLPWSIARGVRSGAYAVALLQRPFLDDAYVIIDRDTAEKVPDSVVFLNEEPPPETPENGLLEECLSS